MKCLKIYTTTDGESHLAEVEISQSLAQIFPREPPLQVSKRYNASGVKFVTVPRSVGEVGWHHTPERMFGVVLSGTMEFETSDGSKHKVGPGGRSVGRRHPR
jgi:hypothetical protein